MSHGHSSGATEGMPLCRTPGCPEPVESTGVYLGRLCTRQLREHLAMIEDLLPSLLLIMRGQEKAFTLKGAAGGSVEDPSPLNLDAYVLFDELTEKQAWSADEIRTSKGAEEIMQEVLRDVRRADRMVNGEKEQTNSGTYVAMRLSELSPMTPQEIETYFSEEAAQHIEITVRQIYKWRTRGRLHPVDSTWPPRYRVRDVYDAWENRNKHGWVPDSTQHTPPAGVAYTTTSR